MSGRELMLVQVGEALAQVARPYRLDESLPGGLHASLRRLGVACSERTTREELVSLLWARKRSLSLGAQPIWNGPGATPPNAA